MRSHLDIVVRSLLIAAGAMFTGYAGHAAQKTAAPSMVVYKSPT